MLTANTAATMAKRIVATPLAEDPLGAIVRALHVCFLIIQLA